MRFPGFTDEWKKITLGEIADVTKLAGYEFTKYVIYEDEGEIIALRGLNCKSGQLVLDDVKYIDHSDLSKLTRSKLYIGDILFTYVGTVGEVAIIDKNDKYYLAPNVSRIRLRPGNCEGFVMQQLSSKKFYNSIVFPLIATSSQPALSMENVRKFVISIPSIKEQNKIAQLLSIIDERIATQNKIIEDLKKLKSAIVEKLMTPQKEWKSTKIGNVLSIGSGRDYKHLEDGNIPVYGTGGYMLSVDSYLHEGESVCIGRKGTINKPIFLKGKFWTVDTLFYTHTFRSITPRFCYYLFTTIDWLKYNEASGVPSLSKVAIENISISIPDLVTQKHICAVLDSMTDKLDIEQTLLDAYHAQKQYLLHQIFI